LKVNTITKGNKMGFKKYVEDKDKADPIEEASRLMCSVADCHDVWTVKLDGRPKCSKHQWEKKKDSSVDEFDRYFPKAILPTKPKTVSMWYDDKDDDRIL